MRSLSSSERDSRRQRQQSRGPGQSAVCLGWTLLKCMPMYLGGFIYSRSESSADEQPGPLPDTTAHPANHGPKLAPILRLGTAQTTNACRPRGRLRSLQRSTQPSQHSTTPA